MDNEKKPAEKSSYGREIFRKLGDRLLREADAVSPDDALKIVEAMERAQKLG